MAFSKKKHDPISDKARALNDQIAALESEIKRLDSQLTKPAEPRFRASTPAPKTAPFSPAEKPAPPPPPADPVFEQINRPKLTTSAEPEAPELFNELGVRKYDLPALLARLRNHFRGPATSNPRLVNYLAAGGVQGLRPLRYEKRIARNRFVWLVIVVSVVLFGIFYIFFSKR
jgi:hypothetical protein